MTESTDSEDYTECPECNARLTGYYLAYQCCATCGWDRRTDDDDEETE